MDTPRIAPLPMPPDKQTAIDKTLRLLADGRIQEACRACVEYEAKQEHPHGVGITWDEAEYEHMVSMQTWVQQLTAPTTSS